MFSQAHFSSSVVALPDRSNVLSDQDRISSCILNVVGSFHIMQSFLLWMRNFAPDSVSEAPLKHLTLWASELGRMYSCCFELGAHSKSEAATDNAFVWQFYL